ncbi:hypothetical protein [Treponema sp.]|uniref:hypothetical protein n=1 Tax=Treponema sp. TaxID=166 RepID=UPI003FD75A51
MDCYIFGAGASKSYSASPTNQKMPVAKDFFSTFNKLKITSNPWVLIGKTLNYVKEKYHIDYVNFDSFNEDIEKLNSEIYNDFLKAYQNNDYLNWVKYYSVSVELTFIFISVINEIQNGPESLMHKNFVQQLCKDDCILTFNWDTLLDKSLFNSGHWFPDTGYGIIPKQIYSNGWRNPNNNTSDFELLKLHGSSNWLTSAPVFDKKEIIFSHTTGADNVFVYQDTKEPYACYDGRFMEGYEPFSYGYYPPNLFVESVSAPEGHIFYRTIQRNGFNNRGNASDEGIISIPLIITPIKQKNYSKYGSLFNTLWDKAKEKLIMADRIFLVGYSFPKTDIKTDELFYRAFTSRKTIPGIVIINPFPEEIIDKFKLQYGIPETNIKVDKCFMDKNYDFLKWKS